ncbi:MAG: WbqC family protein [Vicinamibacterales bacterium]
MKRVAVLQSNYIPWKGYFDIIHDVDTFIFYDDVQYTTRDWRNRNRIKTEAGPQWLTVPVGSDRDRLIRDVMLPADSGWAGEHWRRIARAYRSAPFFDRYRPYFEAFYLRRSWRSLSELNQALIVRISCDLLGVATQFEQSADYRLTASKGERIIELLKRCGAERYVSGPSARAYLTDAELAAAGIDVVWKDYRGYPEYAQLHGEFRHDVSILDLLFHTGPAAAEFIWGWRSVRNPAEAGHHIEKAEAGRHIGVAV